MVGCATGWAKAQSRSHLLEDNYKGRVKTVRIEIAKIVDSSNGPTEIERVVVSNTSYDKRGNETSATVNDRDGSRKYSLRWTHLYDDKGREIRTEYLDSNGQLTNTGITHYREDGYERGQYNPNGTVNHVFEAFLDENGKLVRDSRKYQNGKSYEHLYKYDKQGRLIERINREIGGSTIDKSTWTYDDHGNQTSFIVEKADGTVVPMFKFQYEYDSQGHIVVRRDYDPDGSMFMKWNYSYEFDDQGNWIKLTAIRQSYSKHQVRYDREVTYRFITYY